MSDRQPTQQELRARLTPEQYRVTRQCGMEPAFTGRHYHNQDTGMYLCVCCGESLFSSQARYDSGSGWPSFWQPVAATGVETRRDTFKPKPE